MGARMFVAALPPTDVVAALDEFVEPRRGEGLRWTDAETWHVTLAFYGDVPEFRYEELRESLAAVARRRNPFPMALGNAGAFPSVARARVLWLGVSDPNGALPPLAAGCRTAGSRCGIEVAAERFRAHVTLARTNGPVEATRWVRVVETFESREWVAKELVLIESHLGQGPHGRPRYEVRERFTLGEAEYGEPADD